ncbi:MAG TPA: hypothetical protein VII57_01205 [Dehalococcoidia bacterium]
MNLEPWRDQHPLEGPFLKLERAEKHLKTIDEYLAKFEAFNPHRVSFKLDSGEAFYEARLHAIFPPFLDFWTIIGEFCYQVRSALDHIVYALAVFPPTLSEAQRAKAERDTAFPIGLERQANDSGVRNRLIWIPKAAREDAFKIIDAVQPYKRGDRLSAFDDPLALLDELSNLDKHRLFKLLPVTIRINLVDLAPGIKTTNSGSPNHGDVIAWIPAHLNPEVEFHPRLTAEVVLPVTRHGGHVKMPSLGVIHNRVRHDILPEFKKFFGPLPPSVKI